jgi:hypothetical protein
VSFLDPPRLATQVPRTPVHLAQAVENRSANAKLCVRRKLHVLGAVKFLQRVNQSNYAGMYQVLKRNMPRHPFVNTPRDIADLRQLLGEQALAPFLVLPRPLHLPIQSGEAKNAIKKGLRYSDLEKPFPILQIEIQGGKYRYENQVADSELSAA